MSPNIPTDPLHGPAARQASLVEALVDGESLGHVYAGQWPRVEEETRDYVDRILAALRDRPRPLGARMLDLLPGFRVIASGSSHPRPARLSPARRAACRRGVSRRIADLVDGGRIGAWEGAAFLADLDGQAHGLIARNAHCDRWSLERSLLRTRRWLLRGDAVLTATDEGVLP